MWEGAARRLENSLICGVIACFCAQALYFGPLLLAILGFLIAFFAHIVGIGFALSVIRQKPFAAVVALALNLSTWFTPIRQGFPFWYS